MPEDKKTLRTAYIKLSIAIAIWGGSFIAIKIAVRDVSPVTVVWLRFLIGTVILGYMTWKQKDLALSSWKDRIELVLLGFLGVTLHQMLQSSGLMTSEASTTAWLVSTTPVFIALLGWAFLKEKLTWKTISGILLATIGVMLVVTKGNINTIFSGNFGAPGDILIILSAPNWALFSVLSQPILERLSSMKVTFYVFLFGWLLTSIQFVTGSYWAEIPRLTTTGWISIVFLGVFCSAVAYMFYNDGLKAMPTSHVGVFLYLEPLVATIVAAIVLSESIVLASLAGGAFILFGVWIVNHEPVEA